MSLCLLTVPPARADWPQLFQGAEYYSVGDWPSAAATRGGLPFGIASGDLNGDGLPDIVVTNNRSAAGLLGSTVSVLVHAPSSPSQPSLFQAKTSYQALTGPNSVAMGDVNRDGNLDVVVGANVDTVAVLLGNGTGALGAPTLYSGSRASGVGGLKVGDVNNDTWPDLILARDSAVPEGITVMLNTGTGTFGPGVGYSSGLGSASMTALALGDATGDGIVDVVGVGGGTGVVVFQGNNTGSFTALTPMSTSTTACIDVEVGLLNADAIPDIVVSENTSPVRGVSVLVGTGGGGFLPFVFHSSDQSVGDISLGDFDKDGALDIVASGMAASGNKVTVFTGKGDGSLDPPAHYVDSPSTWRSVLVDFDLDGWLDLASPNYAAAYDDRVHVVSLLRSDRAGGFRANLESFEGRKPTRVATADFNRDGRLDVIASDSLGVTVGLGNGDGTFVMTPKFALSPDPGNIVVADWNRDGKTDFAVQKGAGQVFGYTGLGDGTFAISPLFSLTGTIFRRSVADMNRDGRSDLVLSSGSNSVSVLTLDPGSASFSTAGTGTTSGSVQSLATADWNRDANLDVAVATTSGVAVFLGSATGSIGGSPLVLMSGRSYRDMCAGDFNRDGALDLAAIESTAGQSGTRGADVFLGNGAGGFGPPTSLATLEQNGYVIESWDANADGRPDLVASELADGSGVFTSIQASMEAFLGGGDGTFPTKTAHSLQLTAGANIAAPYFAAGDVTGDGLPDLLSPSTLLLGNNNYRLETLRSIAPPRGVGLGPRTDYASAQASRVAVGDLNRDGIPDVVTGSPNTPGVTVRLGTSSGTLGPSTTLAQSLGLRQVGLADFNRDGILDLVTSRTSLGPPEVVSCMLGIGDGTFGARVDHPTVNVVDFAIADMNRDGRLDVVTGQAGASFVQVLLGNGDGTFAAQAAMPVPWVYDLDTADVNRDGILDVVLVDGGCHLLYGAGDGTLSVPVEVPLGLTTLQSVCVADFDRDGYVDVAAGDQSGHIVTGWGAATPPFSIHVTSNLPTSGWDFQAGAAKVDGEPYLYMSTFSNEVVVLKQGSPGVFAIAARSSTGSDPEALALFDLNRDGALDVVTANSGSGAISLLLHHVSLVTAVENVPEASLPVRLWQNHPNPFNPVTTIRYSLQRADRVRLEIYDVQGRVVTTLVDGQVSAGDHSVVWRGRNERGSDAGSGVYFYKLSTGSGRQESRRMVLLK